MGRRRKQDPLDYVALPDINLDPQIKKGIFVVFILLFGAISFLSLFDLAGAMGIYVAKALTLGLGWGKWIFPAITIFLGYVIYRGENANFRGANHVGLFLFLISFQSLLHLFIALTITFAEPITQGDLMAQLRKSIDLGVGGGFVGLFLASTLIKLLGLWGSLVSVFGVLLISLMLLLNTTLSHLIGRNSWFAKLIVFINSIFSKFFGLFKREKKDEVVEEQVEEEQEEEQQEEIEEEEEETGFSKKKIGAPKEAPGFMSVAKVLEKKKKEDEPVFKQSNVQIDIPMDLLTTKAGKAIGGDIKTNMEVIKHTLENFGIPVEMGEVSVGPTVTQYTFKPADGVKLSRITTLNNDLALALAAHPIRIEAPIPGKSVVGIEVPNQAKAIVGMKEILSDATFTNRKSNLMMALGKDVSGKSWLDDLAKMPHLLVAGATNSGKSVCLNAIIVSLLYQNNPDDLKFIMVDPKRVELTVYNGIPHLLTPVITDVSKTINALKWCLNEMDRRFETLAKVGKRNIQSYNQSLKKGEAKMPYLVFIIDELADLMVAAARDVEPSIIRLAQMARAVGIHLILATQRPSVDVITGVIKANMPARIAFSVASGIDSRTILDTLGAEKLLGRGDMLFSTAELQKPKRIQGGYIDDNEIKKIVTYIKEKCGEPNYVDGITDRQKVGGIGGVGLGGGGNDDDCDDLLLEAKEMVIGSGKASASYLQRRLSIGYARAARLLDLLEEAGVVGPSNGSKPREIMITKEQYENMMDQGVSGVSLHNRDEAVAPDEYLGGSEDEEEDEEEEVGEVKEYEVVDMPIHDEIESAPADIGDKGDLDEDEDKYFAR